MMAILPESGHRKTDILVLLGCFGRGIEATGPNQSMIGMAQALTDRFQFRVLAEAVTGDRVGHWQEVSGLAQMPLASGVRNLAMLRAMINQTPHQVLIANGFFDRRMTLPMLLMRRMGLIASPRVLLAPRGEFSPGALALGRRKKALYIQMCRKLGLLNDVALQATSAEEAQAIRSTLEFTGQIHITPNIRPIVPLPPAVGASADSVRLVFASRIDRKKNLHLALEQAAASDVPIIFDIYGPVTDETYWADCKRVANRLPNSVRVTYRGVAAQNEIVPILARYDLMMLPTLGENFGHAIADSLLAGTPVLISDQTPWRNLAAQHAGWDLPLCRPAEFSRVLRLFKQMSTEERQSLRDGARALAERRLDSDLAAGTMACVLDELAKQRTAQSEGTRN